MKRFTDTEKWRDPWFRRLKPEHKLAWDYVCTNCDNAGVWVVDWDLFGYLSGVTVQSDEVLESFSGRVVDIGRNRWWIQKFIRFQFGELVLASRVHQSVVNLLHHHGIHSLFIDYTKGIQGVVDTPKDKDIDIDKDKDTPGKGSGENQAEEIYQAYPLKVGKPAALKAIQRALTKEPFEALLAKTLRFAAAKGTDLAYCPHPSTWFNQDRYNDDPATWIRNESTQRPHTNGVNRNHGTLNNPSRYSAENLRKLPNYHGADPVRDAKPATP
jgi:hypothetical protein